MTQSSAVATWRPFPELSYGQTESLKWIAFSLMVNEHFWRYVIGDDHGLAWQIGRVVFPLFAWVLAYNLGRNWSADGVRRVVVRLLIFGLVAQPFAIYLTGSYRLNVLFTLAAGLVLAFAWIFSGRHAWICAAVALLASPFAEFDLFGVALVFSLTVWQCSQRLRWAIPSAVSLAALYLVNGNWLALLFVPLVVFAVYLPMQFPRVRGLFYYLYPAHLAALSLIAFLAP